MNTKLQELKKTHTPEELQKLRLSNSPLLGGLSPLVAKQLVVDTVSNILPESQKPRTQVSDPTSYDDLKIGCLVEYFEGDGHNEYGLITGISRGQVEVETDVKDEKKTKKTLQERGETRREQNQKDENKVSWVELMNLKTRSNLRVVPSTICFVFPPPDVSVDSSMSEKSQLDHLLSGAMLAVKEYRSSFHRFQALLSLLGKNQSTKDSNEEKKKKIGDLKEKGLVEEDTSDESINLAIGLEKVWGHFVSLDLPFFTVEDVLDFVHQQTGQTENKVDQKKEQDEEEEEEKIHRRYGVYKTLISTGRFLFQRLDASSKKVTKSLNKNPRDGPYFSCLPADYVNNLIEEKTSLLQQGQKKKEKKAETDRQERV